MRIEKCFIIFTCMLGMATSLSNNECKTPNYRNGYCINIKDCPQLLKQLIIHRNKSSDLAKIKKYHCGTKGNITKVCCPLDKGKTSVKRKNIMNVKTQLPSQSSCGVPNVTHSKNTKAKLGDWPWMAVLGYECENVNKWDLQWYCGGTLISSTHVLTAAHCLTHTKCKLTTIRLGELDLDTTVDDGARPIDVPVDRVIIHEKFNQETYINDIALVKFRKSVDFNEFIQPICLPIDELKKNADMSRNMAILAGWGVTNTNLDNNYHDFSLKTALRQVKIPVLNISICINAYSNENLIIDESVLCAGHIEGGDDSCLGDSGGPLMTPKGKQYFLMGIVSYGSKICGQQGHPSVYTRVPAFIDWIVNTLNEI